ncbi:MAG: hypothetical protein ABSA41_20195 [Terriglobia bacterium]|jgi:hypothetical protein
MLVRGRKHPVRREDDKLEPRPVAVQATVYVARKTSHRGDESCQRGFKL